MENKTKQGANWEIKQRKQNNLTWWEKERKGRKERKNRKASQIEVDKNDLYILKNNYDRKRVRKANKRINIMNFKN